MRDLEDPFDSLAPVVSARGTPLSQHFAMRRVRCVDEAVCSAYATAFR